MKTENCYNPMSRRGFNWALKLQRWCCCWYLCCCSWYRCCCWWWYRCCWFQSVLMVMLQVRSEGGAQQRGRRRGRGAMMVSHLSINQSINQSINRSIGQSINQWWWSAIQWSVSIAHQSSMMWYDQDGSCCRFPHSDILRTRRLSGSSSCSTSCTQPTVVLQFSISPNTTRKRGKH